MQSLRRGERGKWPDQADALGRPETSLCQRVRLPSCGAISMLPRTSAISIAASAIKKKERSLHPQPWRPPRRLPALAAEGRLMRKAHRLLRPRTATLHQRMIKGELGEIGEPLRPRPDEPLLWRRQHAPLHCRPIRTAADRPRPQRSWRAGFNACSRLSFECERSPGSARVLIGDLASAPRSRRRGQGFAGTCASGNRVRRICMPGRKRADWCGP